MVRDYGYSQDRDIYGHPTTHVPALATVEDIRCLLYGPLWWRQVKQAGVRAAAWAWAEFNRDCVIVRCLWGTAVMVVGYLWWVMAYWN